MAAAPGQEALQRQLGAVDQPHQVDVDHPVRGGVGLVDERADGHDPGVVDQDIQRAEPVLYLIQERGEAVAIGHIQREPDRSPSQLARGLLGQCSVDVADGHAGPLGDQSGRGGAADPASSARDCDYRASKRTWDFGHVGSS